MCEKRRLCLEIISGSKTRTEMTRNDFAILFDNKKYLKNPDYPDQNEITQKAIQWLID